VHLTRLVTRSRAALIAGAALAVMITSPAFAHEERPTGQVVMTVGWINEPTYTGFPNGVALFLNDPAGAPVTDLGDALKVEVSLGEEKMGPLALEPAFGDDFGTPGEYHANLIPTRPGAYTFHFTGTVRGEAIDETFTASEEHGEGFSLVEDDSAVSFPAQDPTRAELAQRIERIDPRLTRAQQQLTASTDEADDAKSTARIATVLAAVALVIALVVGGVALLRGRRREAGRA
jgi:hypothetical protein